MIGFHVLRHDCSQISVSWKRDCGPRAAQGISKLNKSLFLFSKNSIREITLYKGDSHWEGGDEKSSQSPFHHCISLFLSSFVRNADKLSIHTKCSSHPIGCSVPMWLLLANSSAGTFGAVWGWSVAPLHHCSNRLPWQHTRPLPHCFSVYVEHHFVLNVYRHRVPTGLENHWKFVDLKKNKDLKHKALWCRLYRCSSVEMEDFSRLSWFDKNEP